MVRIQLDLPDERARELDALVDELSLGSRKELFNNALTLFKWALGEKRAGRAIASIDEAEQKVREVMLPALESAKPEPGRNPGKAAGEAVNA